MTDYADFVQKFDQCFEKLEKFEKTLGGDHEDKWSDVIPKSVDNLKGNSGIADFWQHILLNHPSLADHVTEEDRTILAHVKSLHSDMSFIKPQVVTIDVGFN